MNKKKKVSTKRKSNKKKAVLAVKIDRGLFELQCRDDRKRSCPHRRTNSDGSFQENLNIKWMRHSNDIITGVCGTCFSPFDTRDPQDLQWFLKDTRGQKWMAKAVATSEEIKAIEAANPTSTIALPTPNRWQKFVEWFKGLFRSDCY
jgi:hypothetical protein